MDNSLLNAVDRATAALMRWLQNVEGFPAISADERRSYALELAYRLQTGSCRCGRRLCGAQHHIAGLPSSGLDLVSFVFRAVIGPYGYRARSIEQGMLFPVLSAEWDLEVVPVRFHTCSDPECGYVYMGARCTRCGRAYSDQTTEVIGQPWLVRRGVFVPLRFWGCGDERRRHYYSQSNCRERVIASYPRIRYRTIHGGRQHDRCPWVRCPQGAPRHSQRGTTLWIRGSPDRSDAGPLFFQ